MGNWLAQHLEQLPLGLYDNRELGSLEVITDGILDGKLECLFLGVWLGPFDGLNIDTNECIVLGKELETLGGLLLCNMMK